VSWVDLGPLPEPGGEELRDVRAGARIVGLAMVGNRWVAFDPWCPHAECPLTDGWLEGVAVRCACHGGLFDLETGTALEGPTHDPVTIFPTRVVDGRLEAEIGGVMAEPTSDGPQADAAAE
jgi:nitrite reductase/ring-hydroxylating ferredoxin subunit